MALVPLFEGIVFELLYRITIYFYGEGYIWLLVIYFRYS
jgi:hypothetical protein